MHRTFAMLTVYNGLIIDYFHYLLTSFHFIYLVHHTFPWTYRTLLMKLEN